MRLLRYNFQSKNIIKPNSVESKWGIVSKNGEVLLPIEYDSIGEPQDGFFIVKKNGKYGIDDLAFNNIIPFKYDSVKPWYKTYLKVGVDNTGIGIISLSDEVLVLPEYDEIGDVWEDAHCFTVKKENKEGLFDIDFKPLIPCSFHSIVRWDDDLFKMSMISKRYNGYGWVNEWGIITRNGGILLNPFYDEIGPLDKENNCFVVKRNHRYGIMDLSFNLLIPCEYEDIKPWGNSLFKVTFNASGSMNDGLCYCYLINKQNARIDNTDYSEVSDLSDGKAIAYTMDYRQVVLDVDGHIVDDLI